MGRVSCSVGSCSYNERGVCYAGTIKIGGQGAAEEEGTCCGSFLNQRHYSNLSEYTSMRGATDEINCAVGTCEYNSDEKCTLKSIQVGGGREIQLYSETECQSFERKAQ